MAYVAADQPEQAATVASEALAIALSAGSTRTCNGVVAVALRLQPLRRLPAVARLLDELAAAPA